MSFDKELAFAKDVAFKAGEMMLAGFSKANVSIKSNLTPVTETDLAISRFVIAQVQKNFPDHAILDEEIHTEVPDSEYIWVCDPIDGTIPFAHHIPTSMFSLALCFGGEPVVAVTYDPYVKRMLYTQKGAPSYMNDKEIRMQEGDFAKGDVVYGLTHWDEGFNRKAFLHQMVAKDLRVTMVESLVYQCMLVALGLTKAMVSVAGKPWDRAAAILIIQNAGGKCTDEKGNTLTVFGNPKLFIATNGTVHDEVLQITQSCYSS